MRFVRVGAVPEFSARRFFKSDKQPEKSAFSAPALADDGYELPGWNVNVEGFQNLSRAE
jgi:hypothetical protein